MKKILCIGEALIDMICTDKGRSLSDGDNFLKKAGGAPTNVAAAIAALGGQVDLAAKVGVDPFGQHLIDVMNAFQVNTQWVFRDPQHFTTFAFVSLMENGERDFYFNRGADGQLSEADLQNIDLNDYAIVHFGSATGFLDGPLKSAYKSLLEKAKAANCFISFDPNYRHLLFQHQIPSFVEQSWHFIRHCDFFKVSDEEALLLSGAATVAEAAQILMKDHSATLTITLGKEGTLLGKQGATQIIPSMPIVPVDTTGAGDAFVGAVLYQLNELAADTLRSLGVPQWESIIHNGNKAGARTCEYLGAMEAFKHLNNSIFL